MTRICNLSLFAVFFLFTAGLLTACIEKCKKEILLSKKKFVLFDHLDTVLSGLSRNNISYYIVESHGCSDRGVLMYRYHYKENYREHRISLLFSDDKLQGVELELGPLYSEQLHQARTEFIPELENLKISYPELFIDTTIHPTLQNTFYYIVFVSTCTVNTCGHY